MNSNLSQREKECFRLLSLIPRDKDYVVIGGYSVSSYGFPRFSVDLDIVIPDGEVSFFKKIITGEGFVLDKQKNDLDYGGKFERYVKDLLSIDFLINAVQSRQTGYSYSFSYLFDNSEVRDISGWDPTLKVKIRVPHKEMIIALKIHSMRSADKRDIIMLCYEKPDQKKIKDHLENCPKQKIKDNIVELKDVINNQNLKDSLKGVFSINDQIFNKSIQNCLSMLEYLLKNLDF